MSARQATWLLGYPTRIRRGRPLADLVQIDIGHLRCSGYESIWPNPPHLHKRRSPDRTLAGYEAQTEGDPVEYAFEETQKLMREAELLVWLVDRLAVGR